MHLGSVLEINLHTLVAKWKDTFSNPLFESIDPFLLPIPAVQFCYRYCRLGDDIVPLVSSTTIVLQTHSGCLGHGLLICQSESGGGRTVLFEDALRFSMPFSVSWHTVLEELEELADGAELIAPLSHDRFSIVDVQEHRVVIMFSETGERRPLQRDQFETLYRRIQDSGGEFALDRLPVGADPYPAVLSVHPRFEIDEKRGVIIERDDVANKSDASGRTEPEGIDVYADALLLIDALERHDMSDLTTLETDTLVNVYTLCSDVQRNADDLRKALADVLLDRIHHDQPVYGQYGSVQRTSRRNRSLRDEKEILSTLEAAGIDRERVMSVDSNKVAETLQVTELAESDVYEISEREYVRKVEVDEEVKASRLQGLKDRLATSDDTASNELRQEIEALEDRIDELTSFSAGTQL